MDRKELGWCYFCGKDETKLNEFEVYEIIDGYTLPVYHLDCGDEHDEEID